MILIILIVGLFCSIISTVFVLSAVMRASQTSRILEEYSLQTERPREGRAARNWQAEAIPNLRSLASPAHRIGASGPQ